MFRTEDYCGKTAEELRALHHKRIRQAVRARRKAEKAALISSRATLQERREAGGGVALHVFEVNGRAVYRDAYGVTLPFVKLLARG